MNFNPNHQQKQHQIQPPIMMMHKTTNKNSLSNTDIEVRFFFGFQVSGLGMVPEPDTRTFKTCLYPKPDPENLNLKTRIFRDSNFD